METVKAWWPVALGFDSRDTLETRTDCQKGIAPTFGGLAGDGRSLDLQGRSRERLTTLLGDVYAYGFECR